MSHFCCLSGNVGPAQTAKKKHAPAQAAKKKQAPDSSERVYVFCCLGGIRFLLFGPGGACFFCCLGGGVLIFVAVRAGCMWFFCCLGRVRVWAGGVFFCCLGEGREFTHLPVCLARLEGTQQQKDQTAKTKHGFRRNLQGFQGRRIRHVRCGSISQLFSRFASTTPWQALGI